LLRKITSPLFIGAALALTIGVAGTASGATRSVSHAPSGECVGDFSADITRGPYADLSLAGRLTLLPRPHGRLVGFLVRKDEATSRYVKVADVNGKRSRGRVRLSFRTVHGRRVSGVGLASGERRCRGTLRGALTTPHGGRGVWKMATTRFIHIPAPSFYTSLGCEPGIDGIILPEGGSYDCNTQSFVV
jgi:hypothetical protein